MEQPEDPRLTSIRNLSIKYRGMVIQNCTLLERSIEAFISKYLTSDEQKQIDIFVFLLDRMTFDAKISVFESILKRDNSKADFKKKYDKLLGKIRMVKDERNVFAHYSMSSDIDGINSYPEVNFLSFRNKVDSKKYQPKQIVDLIETINRCTEEVMKLFKNPPSPPSS